MSRLEDKPFVLIGVNSDRDRAQLKEVIRQEGISWRSFWDGGSPKGPIAMQWNVHAWPTLYVLDDRGIIRFKNVFGAELDRAVDLLLAEVGTTAPK